MKIQSLGHVEIKVRGQQRAEAFYHGLLGIPIAARILRFQSPYEPGSDVHPASTATPETLGGAEQARALNGRRTKWQPSHRTSALVRYPGVR